MSQGVAVGDSGVNVGDGGVHVDDDTQECCCGGGQCDCLSDTACSNCVKTPTSFRVVFSGVTDIPDGGYCCEQSTACLWVFDDCTYRITVSAGASSILTISAKKTNVTKFTASIFSSCCPTITTPINNSGGTGTATLSNCCSGSVPASCPCDVPSTLLVTGGPVTITSDANIPCTESDVALTRSTDPWDGVMTRVGVQCRWEFPQNTYGSWQGKAFYKPSYGFLMLQVGLNWFLQLPVEASPTNRDAQYFKPIGNGPRGVYTASCAIIRPKTLVVQ